MELKNRLDLLIQSAELSQQNGVFTLDDAVIVKSAVDNIKENKNLKESVNVLIKIAQIAQKKGVFSLKDAFFIYMAIDGIDKELDELENTNERKSNTKAKKGEE